MKLTLCLLLNLVGCALMAQPKIKMESFIHDYGTTDQFVEVKHVFPFRNLGDEDLIVSRVTSS